MFKKKKNITPEWIVAGLGNPGVKYENNRHNAGFICMDLISEKQNIKINTVKFNALIGYGAINGRNCLLMKPTILS